MKLLHELKKRCASLAHMPGQGRQRNEFSEFVRVRGLRSSAAGSYIIFYRQTNYGVLVIRILHHSRDLEQIFTPDTYSGQVTQGIDSGEL